MSLTGSLSRGRGKAKTNRTWQGGLVDRSLIGLAACELTAVASFECILWAFPLFLSAGLPPGRHLGHYPSLPPGYQNTSAPHGATSPMHPAMQAATQPYSQAPQPYQQVSRETQSLNRLLIICCLVCEKSVKSSPAPPPASHLLVRVRPSWARPWLPWASSPAPRRPWEWSTCCRRGTCCHRPPSLPRHHVSHRTSRRSTATQSKPQSTPWPCFRS